MMTILPLRGMLLLGIRLIKTLPKNSLRDCLRSRHFATLTRPDCCSRNIIFCENKNVSKCCVKYNKPLVYVEFSTNWNNPKHKKRNRTTLIYIASIGVIMVGAAYAGVPLYRIFCQATGLGGQAVVGHDTEKVEGMKSVKDRIIRIQFNADTASSLKWNFKPQQSEVKVYPGETSLAFYTAKNPTDKPVVGISTYNVVPFEAGQYFNKIQCFCFEEQRLNPHEQVDMPVFFYIDPEFADDPKLQHVDRIILSYTFFEAKDGMDISKLPGYLNQIAAQTQ